MGLEAGWNGTIAVGPTPTLIALIRTTEVNDTVGEVDVGAGGSQDEAYLPGQMSTTISADGVYDRAGTGGDDGQLALTIGSEIAVEITIGSDSTGNKKRSGNMFITSYTEGFDRAGEATFSFTARSSKGKLAEDPIA